MKFLGAMLHQTFSQSPVLQVVISFVFRYGETMLVQLCFGIIMTLIGGRRMRMFIEWHGVLTNLYRDYSSRRNRKEAEE